jgi:hypothetical protein
MNRTLLMAAGQVTCVTAIPARRCAPKLVTYAWTCHAIATAALNLLECHRFRCQRVLESGGCVSRRARTRLVAERGAGPDQGDCSVCSFTADSLLASSPRSFAAVVPGSPTVEPAPINVMPIPSRWKTATLGVAAAQLVMAGMLGLKRLGDEPPAWKLHSPGPASPRKLRPKLRSLKP